METDNFDTVKFIKLVSGENMYHWKISSKILYKTKTVGNILKVLEEFVLLVRNSYIDTKVFIIFKEHKKKIKQVILWTLTKY